MHIYISSFPGIKPHRTLVGLVLCICVQVAILLPTCHSFAIDFPPKDRSNFIRDLHNTIKTDISKKSGSFGRWVEPCAGSTQGIVPGNIWTQGDLSEGQREKELVDKMRDIVSKIHVAKFEVKTLLELYVSLECYVYNKDYLFIIYKR